MNVRTVQRASDELDVGMRTRLRSLLWASFDDFNDHEWEHALGGIHIVAIDDGVPVGHAAVVRRPISIGDQVVDVGYVEAVAVDAARRGQGIGSAVMREAGQVISDGYPVGVLSTHRHHFYERLGWQRWQGPTFVDDGDGRRRTPDEDAGVMALLSGQAGGAVDLSASIAVAARAGDDW